jgi:hypothetical protein
VMMIPLRASVHVPNNNKLCTATTRQCRGQGGREPCHAMPSKKEIRQGCMRARKEP